MHKLIDGIAILIMLLIIILNGDSSIERLGSSLIFVPLISYIYFLSFAYKKMQIELTIIIYTALVVVGIHYISYSEVKQIYPFSYIVFATDLSSLLLIISFIVINLRAMKMIATTDGSSVQANQIKIIKMIIFRFSIIAVSTFPIIQITGHAFSKSLDSGVPKYNALTFSSFSLFLLIIFIVITFIVLKKIPSKYYVYALHNRIKCPVKNIKSHSIVGGIIMLILGSGMEIIRGFWVLWIETVIFVSLLIATSWIIWKCILEEPGISGYTESEQLVPFSNYSFFLKFITIFTLLGMIYGTILVVILR